MNIIRHNSFRKINFFEKNSFFCKSAQLCTETKDYHLSMNEKIMVKKYLEDKKLVTSKYNITKTYKDNKTVIINTLYDSVVVLDEDETSCYENVSCLTCKCDSVIKLYLLGILIEEKEDESFVMNMQNEELILNRKGIPSITIFPTQACNARCAYCFAEHNEKKTMTRQVISNLVNFLKENFSEGDRVQLRWFGGEPLLAIDVIDKIIDDINKEFRDKLQYESIMFTNGSLLTDEIILVAKKKWHLEKIQLTLDGYGNEHNERKSYSTKGIDYYIKTIDDIGKLLDVGIKVDCRVNLDKDNIKQIDKILHDLIPYRNNKLFRPRLTILMPSDCGNNKFNYITNSDLEWAYSIIYNKLYQYGFLKDVKDLIPQRQKESCIAKSMNKVIVSSNGNLYKCEQQVFDENNMIGDLENGINQRRYMDYCKYDICEECKECVYLPICSGGCLAYWQLKEKENITPCIREKYFINLLLDMIHKWENLK